MRSPVSPPDLDEEPPLGLGTRLAYGLGELGEGLEGTALDSFLFFFYVQVRGLSGASVGMALFAALLVDALTNPLIGTLSDTFQSKIGRRHPFLYAAPLPLAAALVLVFSPPAAPAIAIAWLVACTLLCRIAFALYFIPHMALGAELTADFGGRLSVASWRVIFSYGGRLLALFVAFSIFFRPSPDFANGQLNPHAYRPFAIFCAIVIAAAIFTSARLTQNRAVRMYRRMRPTRRFRPSDIAADFGRAFRSGSFAALFAALLILYITTGVQAALALHMNTFFWCLTPHQIQLVSMSGLAGFVAGVPLANWLGRRLDKPPVFVGGIFLFFIFTYGPTCLRLGNLFPGAGNPDLPTVLQLCVFLAGLFGAAPLTVSAAMMADLTDEFELRNGYRTEGFFFGLNAVTRKASIGLGGALAGFAIDWIQFPKHAAPGQVAPAVLLGLGTVYGPVIAVLGIAGLTVMACYRLDRQRQAGLLGALARHRATTAMQGAEVESS